MGNQVHDERLRPAAVECTFLIEQRLDVFPVANHHGGILKPFHRENASIFLGPLRHADRFH